MKTISVRKIRSELLKLLSQVGSGKLSMKDARQRISALLATLDSGEEIIILKDGEAIAKLLPLE